MLLTRPATANLAKPGATGSGSGDLAGASRKNRGRHVIARMRLEPPAMSASRVPRLPALRGPRDRHRLGTLAWTFAVPLQDLRAHVQHALTKTPMAHLRKKEKWLDHARAMIEGKEAWRRPPNSAASSPNDDLPLAASVSCRAPASDKPRMLRGIVHEADETFILQILQEADDPTCRERRASEAERPDIRPFTRTIFPFSSPATGRARPSTPSCLKPTALRWEPPRSPASSPPSNHLIGDGDRRRSPLSLARRGFPSTPCRRPGK